MADISTTNKKARVPILGENGRISDAYLPQAVIDAEASSKTYAENAKSYSELVKKDAESAASSAASAKESADAARDGISSIDEKVTQAGQFAEAASSSATEANNYLEQVTAVSGTVSGIASSVVENAQVAETFANKSKESAASALTASTNAVNAKVDAEGYRDSAKSYSDNAKADADTAKNILESVKTQKADVDSTVQQFNTDATEYDTKFNGYVSEARESKESSAASAASASESAENASTSAANASTSATDARTSADAVALSATNAANSAKEAVDNLSLLGASTLTRKEKDTFVHVDDAFPSTLLGIEIEGACRQDGTPSPDNPVPIEVIEHPVLHVTGRNLLDIHEGMPESDCNKVFDSNTKRIIKPGTYIAGLSANNYFYANNVLNVHIGNGVVSFTSNAGGYGVGFGVSLVPGVTYKFGAQGNAEFRFAFYSADGTLLSNVTTSTPTVPINAVYSVLVITTKGDSADVALRDIYGAATQITYEPYVGISHAFTLPAEHPYLAKLPDGTADEIIVDKDGNVSLIANVGHMTLAEFASNQLINTDNYEKANDAKGLSGFRINNSEKPNHRHAMCSVLSSEFGSWNKGIISIEWVDGLLVHYPWNELNIAADDSFDTRIDKFKAYAANKNDVHIYYALGDSTKKTYPLGKINLPALPESVSNVWTYAEVTPNTIIEYTRDVNIVVANLESAIASIS